MFALFLIMVNAEFMKSVFILALLMFLSSHFHVTAQGNGNRIPRIVGQDPLSTREDERITVQMIKKVCRFKPPCGGRARPALNDLNKPLDVKDGSSGYFTGCSSGVEMAGLEEF